MTATRRELLAALGGAWLLASLGTLPAVGWLQRHAAPVTPLPSPHGDDEAGHLLARCGFGVRPGDRDAFTSSAAWLDIQLAGEALDDSACARRLARLETLRLPVGECYEFHDHVIRHELQSGILLRAVYSERQLHESVSEFWRDHFSLSAAKGECAWLATGFERDVLQAHALGRFPELLRAAMLHPAMLWYLDGRLNRADQGKPNENYARELLELHTLGLDGGYTQADVQEAARALSGWTTRSLGQSRKGTVVFAADRHDHGAKQVVGTALPGGLGEEEVDRVIAIVVAHPSTARFIARKLCVRYIADDPPAPAIDAVAQVFVASAGDISATLRCLFARDEFRASRGAKLKRPLHFVASALRACAAETRAQPELLAYLERLGHAPYLWPTPDGYPTTADHWRSGLLWRWRFADELARNAIAGTRVDLAGLFARAQGRSGFAAHGLGRPANQAELTAFSSGDDHDALAAILASPGFQRC